MFRSGYVTIARWRGAQVRLHWSIAIAAFVFGGFRVAPGFWLGFVLLVMIHEAGHALLVWRYGHSVRSIEVTGLGGACAWHGNATPFQHSAIAWGGVLAQAVLLGGAYAWQALTPPASVFGWEMMAAFTSANQWLIAINLIPIPPLDGASAWQIFSHWKRRGGGRGVPEGSWRDRSRNVQRSWLSSLEKKSGADRKKARVGVSARRAASHPELSADIPDDREPSPEARRALEDMLRRVKGERGDDD